MKVDMSPEAVTARLKLASQLRRLCLAFGKAQRVGRPLVRPSVGEAPTTYESALQRANEGVSSRPRSSTLQSKE